MLTENPLRSARKAAGLTQKQLAEHAGISYTQVQKAESGEIKPGNMAAKNLLAIADALQVDPRSLID